jgi:SsrA-binding protein
MMPMKVLAKNRRAGFDYEIGERFIAGLALNGDEVKSIKAGSASLKGSFVALKDDEAYLVGAHVTPYSKSSRDAPNDPTRSRKLLLHKRQIQQLVNAKQSGLSVVPTVLAVQGRLIKLEIGIGRGKKRFDKRQVIKKREVTRDLARRIKG